MMTARATAALIFRAVLRRFDCAGDMRVFLLTAITVGLVAGCKKEGPVKAPPPAEPASVERSPFEVVPAGDAVLSVFEPTDGGCQWRRLDALSGTHATVAEFPVANCLGARVAWSANGQLAATWFDPRTVQRAGYGGTDVPASGYADENSPADAKDRVWLVTLTSGALREVPAFPPSDVEDLGLDAKGALHVLGTEKLSDEAVAKGTVTIDGKALALTPVNEGLPALAHAWRLENGAWKRVETVQTTTGWDYAQGAQALELSHALGPQSSTLLESRPHSEEDLEEALSARLAPFAPKGAEGEWRPVGKAPSRAFVWCVSGEFIEATGLVVFEASLTKAEGMGFTAGDLVSHTPKGPYLLSAGSVAGTHPRLFNRATRKLTWSSNTARAVTFWP